MRMREEGRNRRGAAEEDHRDGAHCCRKGPTILSDLLVMQLNFNGLQYRSLLSGA